MLKCPDCKIGLGEQLATAQVFFCKNCDKSIYFGLKPGQRAIIEKTIKYFEGLRAFFGADVFDNSDECEPYREFLSEIKVQFKEVLELNNECKGTKALR